MSQEHESGGEEHKPLSFQKVTHQQVSALLPEHLAGGSFANATIVFNGRSEMVVDFIQRLARPYQCAARVIVPWAVVPGFVQALDEALEKHEKRYGPASSKSDSAKSAEDDPNSPSLTESGEPTDAGVGSAMPGSTDGMGGGGGVPVSEGFEPPRAPNVEDVYQDMKMPDALAGGCYANGMVIRHDQAMFCLDFISNVYPRSVVTSRVYVPTEAIRRVLTSWQDSMKRMRKPPQAGDQEPKPE